MPKPTPQYVQINMDGLDLIERGEPLVKGSIHPVAELIRIDGKTLQDRLSRRWLLPRTEQQYKAWKNTGQVVMTPKVMTPKVLTGRAKRRAEREAAAIAAAEEDAPKMESSPAEPPEEEEEEPLTGTDESGPERGTLLNPLRDGLTMEEYYENNKLPPKPNKKTTRRADCPHCGQTWTSPIKIWNCCPAEGEYTPEDARPPLPEE